MSNDDYFTRLARGDGEASGGSGSGALMVVGILLWVLSFPCVFLVLAGVWFFIHPALAIILGGGYIWLSVLFFRSAARNGAEAPEGGLHDIIARSSGLADKAARTATLQDMPPPQGPAVDTRSPDANAQDMREASAGSDLSALPPPGSDAPRFK